MWFCQVYKGKTIYMFDCSWKNLYPHRLYSTLANSITEMRLSFQVQDLPKIGYVDWNGLLKDVISDLGRIAFYLYF